MAKMFYCSFMTYKQVSTLSFRGWWWWRWGGWRGWRRRWRGTWSRLLTKRKLRGKCLCMGARGVSFDNIKVLAAWEINEQKNVSFPFRQAVAQGYSPKVLRGKPVCYCRRRVCRDLSWLNVLLLLHLKFPLITLLSEESKPHFGALVQYFQLELVLARTRVVF